MARKGLERLLKAMKFWKPMNGKIEQSQCFIYGFARIYAKEMGMGEGLRGGVFGLDTERLMGKVFAEKRWGFRSECR